MSYNDEDLLAGVSVPLMDAPRGKHSAPSSSTPMASPAVQAPEESPAAFSRNARSEKYAARKGSVTNTKTKKRVAIALAAIAALCCLCAGVAFAYVQGLESNIKLDDETMQSLGTELVEVEDEEPFWTLILGSDSRTSSTTGTRSDVIMLVRVDPSEGIVTMVSIPRDTKVYIEGYGYNKINAAYALGGASLAVSTISTFAGVEISHYVEIYFTGFSTLVDSLGGVTVDVPQYCSYDGITLYPGEQTLTGTQALTLARCRKTYSAGDFTRTECQRLLVKALAQKILAMDASSVPGTLTAISECFSTDMSITDICSLALSLQDSAARNEANGVEGTTFYSAMSPSCTGMYNGASYTFTYMNQWKLIMQRANAGEDPTLDDTEQSICGTYSTQSGTLDMSAGLDSSVQAALEEYWNTPAEEETAE